MTVRISRIAAIVIACTAAGAALAGPEKIAAPFGRPARR
jgi:hypothetical protein